MCGCLHPENGFLARGNHNKVCRSVHGRLYHRHRDNSCVFHASGNNISFYGARDQLRRRDYDFLGDHRGDYAGCHICGDHVFCPDHGSRNNLPDYAKFFGADQHPRSLHHGSGDYTDSDHGG